MKESTKLATERWYNFVMDICEDIDNVENRIPEFFHETDEFFQALENDLEALRKDEDLNDTYEIIRALTQD